jgi:hypothetical protein
MTQEADTIKEAAEVSLKEESKPNKKPQIPVQELIDSLKSVADDIGQMNELTSEEKLLVAEFFVSLMKLMQPLTPSMQVSTMALPTELGNVVQANVDPTGYLALLFRDGHLELINLSEEKHRELMLVVVEDVIPKFKQLTSGQKRKIENRIKFLSQVTKEMQKIAAALSTSNPKGSQRQTQ